MGPRRHREAMLRIDAGVTVWSKWRAAAYTNTAARWVLGPPAFAGAGNPRMTAAGVARVRGSTADITKAASVS